MCGIVAFTGNREAQPILLGALRRLEYRGYDSAGLALLEGDSIFVRKKAGRIDHLAKVCSEKPSKSKTGISHTRWATHGEANDVNAHPHLDQSGRLALVHNGVIENYCELKEKLILEGHTFLSTTDTEVFSHLIGKLYDHSKETGTARLVDAVQRSLLEVRGTYGIAAIHADLPDLVVGARRGSPLVLGLGENENFLSSDASALAGYTQRVVYLNDNDVVAFNSHEFNITSTTGRSDVEIHEITTTAEQTDKGTYAHYMLKEIFQQPVTIANSFRGRLDHDECAAKLGGLNLSPEDLRNVTRVVILACGTAMHSGMVGEHIIESLSFIPTEVDHASEFRYRNSPLDRNTLFFVVSQSGETADSLAALREAKRKGFKCLGICNVVGSTIARESDGGVYMHAGPEIGVAATKSFTSQIVVFTLLGLLLGRMRYLSAPQGQEIITALENIPTLVKKALEQAPQAEKIAERYLASQSMLFLGRQFNYPVALEGALKMKEISYIHAEGYPSAELKHGALALIDEKTPSVFIIPNDGLYEKNMSNIQEIKARKGPVIAIATEDDESIHRIADDVLYVPKTHECLQPILNVIPLQLLSYYMAVKLGRDVDKPRNLAKSVTVE